MTLKELIESDVADVFMNTSDFGETITYAPAGGGTNRAIVAIVDEAGTFPSDENGVDSVEILHVTVSRDRDDTTTDGVAIGGIDDPQLGDAIRRENDQESKFYSYSGEKQDADEFGWVLTFTRKITVKHGGSFQSR